MEILIVKILFFIVKWFWVPMFYLFIVSGMYFLHFGITSSKSLLILYHPLTILAILALNSLDKSVELFNVSLWIYNPIATLFLIAYFSSSCRREL